jgi:hypothetical protein
LRRIFEFSSGADDTQTVFGWLPCAWKITSTNIL